MNPIPPTPARETPKKIPSLSMEGTPILPVRVWNHLPPESQDQLFRSLVQLCRHLTAPTLPSEEEIDDPR